MQFPFDRHRVLPFQLPLGAGADDPFTVLSYILPRLDFGYNM